MLALLLAAAQPAEAPPLPDCSYDLEAMLALDRKAFDQTLPDGGWRALARTDGCEIAAAELIRAWRHEKRDHEAILYWHEGQMRAFGGQTAEAIAGIEAEVAALDNTELRILRFADAPDDAGSLALTALAEAIAEAVLDCTLKGRPRTCGLPGQVACMPGLPNAQGPARQDGLHAGGIGQFALNGRLHFLPHAGHPEEHRGVHLFEVVSQFFQAACVEHLEAGMGLVVHAAHLFGDVGQWQVGDHAIPVVNGKGLLHGGGGPPQVALTEHHRFGRSGGA